MIARQIEFPLAVAVCAWCRPRAWGAGLGALSHGIRLPHLRKMKLELQRTAGAAPERLPRRRKIKSPSAGEGMFLPL